MPSWNEDIMVMEFEQLSDRLKTEEGLRDQLAGELAELGRQETAARRIIQQVAELGGHAGDQQRAAAALRKIAAKRVPLERRVEMSKARLQGIRTAMARFDQAELARLGKIRGLFQQLSRGGEGHPQP